MNEEEKNSEPNFGRQGRGFDLNSREKKRKRKEGAWEGGKNADGQLGEKVVGRGSRKGSFLGKKGKRISKRSVVKTICREDKKVKGQELLGFINWICSS